MPDLYVDGSRTGACAGDRRQIRCPADGTLVTASDEATPEDEEMLDWVRADAETALHPSVFPYITNGTIDAPVMMVAEKAADLIAGSTALAASDVPFSRRHGGSGLYPPGDRRNGVTHQAGEEQP